MKATLTIEDLANDLRQLEIDCPHATTRGTLFVAKDGTTVDDAELLSILIDRHEESCRRCVKHLRARSRPATSKMLHLRTQ